MGKNRLVVLSGLVAALLLVSCASVPERELSDKSPLYAALPTGYDPIDLTQFSRMYTVSTSGSGENAIRHLERQHKRPLNILSLSGGGQNGAFGAGFLIGWRERGDRPKFDIVFGVSTGALLATHAFLGTPADDAKLEEMYTEVTKEDIYSDRGIFDLLQGTDSLRDTTPLRALIAKYVTVETLERVAAASDEKRILGVGTTNIDYGQTWIWNMSMIAKAGDVELYRKVLLASSAFPIVFPPVEIDGHLFVDGAARSNVVVVGMGGRTKPEPPPYGPGNVYLIDNGRLNHPPEALRRAIGDVAATTIGVMLNQAMHSARVRSYFGTRFFGYGFNIVSIPDDVNIGKDPLAFDPKQMRAAFDAGRALAMQPAPWSNTPPDADDLPSWAWEAIKDLK